MKTKFALAALAVALVSGPVMAQTAAPAKPSLTARLLAKAKPAAKPVAAKPVVAAKAAVAKPAAVAAKPAAAANGQGQRTAKSLACSKQADAKNIHGQARKSFMSACKKA